MPRSGPSGTATPPPGLVPKNPGDVVPSAGWTNGFTDIYGIFNTPTPTSYGGTGQANLILPANEFGIKDGTDATKVLQFVLSSLPTATTVSVSAPMTSGTLALTNQMEVGQCRMALSGGNIVLSPFNGNGIRIAGVVYQIPSAGVSLAPGVLATATDLNVYAYMNAGVMTLEAVTTAHSKDTTAGNIGVEIKTGDNTRTLVGKVRLAAGPVFVDAANRRFVLSWFNRKNIGVQANFATDRSTGSSSFVEVDSEIRCEFLTWNDEAIHVSLAGSAANISTDRGVITTVGLDGVNPEPVQCNGTSGSAGADQPLSIYVPKMGLSEGYHYYTVLGKTDGSGTATYRGTASTFGRTLLGVMVRG